MPRESFKFFFQNQLFSTIFPEKNWIFFPSLLSRQKNICLFSFCFFLFVRSACDREGSSLTRFGAMQNSSRAAQIQPREQILAAVVSPPPPDTGARGSWIFQWTLREGAIPLIPPWLCAHKKAAACGAKNTRALREKGVNFEQSAAGLILINGVFRAQVVVGGWIDRRRLRAGGTGGIFSRWF